MTKEIKVCTMLTRLLTRLYRSREISKGGTIYKGEIKIQTFSIGVKLESKFLNN